MPQSQQPHWGVNGFRWLVSGLDIASGLGFARLGLLILFDASNWGLFRAIPTGWLGVLVLGHGMWAVVSGVKLITEQSPMRWRAGKRRHLIAATLSGLIIALLWLALLVELSMHSPDGLGLGVGMFVYTTAFGSVTSYFVIVSLVMAKIHRKWRITNPHDLRFPEGVAIHIINWKRAGIAVVYGASVWAVVFGIGWVVQWFNPPGPERGFGPIYAALGMYLGWIPALIVSIWKYRSSRSDKHGTKID